MSSISVGIRKIGALAENRALHTRQPIFFSVSFDVYHPSSISNANPIRAHVHMPFICCDENEPNESFLIEWWYLDL